MVRKLILLFLLFSILSQDAVADAGFNIRRKTATCILTFEGTARLGSYRLVTWQRVYDYSDSLLQHPRIVWLDTMTDTREIVINNAWKRFEESDRDIRLALLDSAGRMTDSLHLFMKKYSYHLLIRGVKDGRLDYQLRKQKVTYEYAIAGEEKDQGQYRTNRLIFILASLAGLLLLTWLFFRRKKLNPA